MYSDFLPYIVKLREATTGSTYKNIASEISRYACSLGPNERMVLLWFTLADRNILYADHTGRQCFRNEPWRLGSFRLVVSEEACVAWVEVALSIYNRTNRVSCNVKVTRGINAPTSKTD